MDEEDFIEHGLYIKVLAEAEVGLDVLAYLEHTDDVVNAALVHGQTAVVRGFDKAQQLRVAAVYVYGHYIDPRGQHALNGDVAELERGGYQVALILVKAALLGHVLDDVVQLILRDGDLAVAGGELRGCLTYPCQQLRERGEKLHKEAEHRRAGESESIAVLLCDALGEHLTGKEHNDSGNDRTYRHGANAPFLCYREGDDRGCGDMYYIGADKQGADGQIKIIQHIESLFCPEVAAFGRRLNAAARCGGHRSLRNSKKCGAYKKQRGNYPRQSTAIIHKRIHISF